MFNSSLNYHPTQTHSNNQAVNISAVSGTFVKSHPKSFFVFGQFGSDVVDKLSGPSPQYLTSTEYEWVERRGRYVTSNTYSDVIVLQAMCAHQEYMIFELMLLEDFENAESCYGGTEILESDIRD